VYCKGAKARVGKPRAVPGAKQENLFQSKKMASTVRTLKILLPKTNQSMAIVIRAFTYRLKQSQSSKCHSLCSPLKQLPPSRSIRAIPSLKRSVSSYKTLMAKMNTIRTAYWNSVIFWQTPLESPPSLQV